MSRSFKDFSIKEYLERLGSGAPTPGGGAAAALTSAQGAALIMMVANHTIGKAKYAEFEELNKDILSEAEILLGSLTDGIDNDAEAFGKVSAAYALPRQFSDIQIDKVSAEIKRLRAEGHTIDDIDEDGMTPEIMDQIEDALREDRQAAIASVSVLAAEAPLMVMEDSLAALRLAATLKGRSNKMLESDIYVAARCLDAGIKSASYNVEANLPAIARADPALASEMREHAASIISAAADIISDLRGKK
ncbi:MAG: cyclodeaminase/cyclohydrolase family protein [Mogibacterium sp.]|nr:cyclodeaminase/cyclohydrolase family protein [Mogibacterium sp.]